MKFFGKKTLTGKCVPARAVSIDYLKYYGLTDDAKNIVFGH
jgi:hypothetical protein